jgi:hypothetical protein
VHISGIHLPVTCECSFISKKTILGRDLIGLQLLLCPLTRQDKILKNHSHAFPGVTIHGKSEMYDV